MYVRVTSTQADPARIDDGIAYIRDEVLPKTNLMKGSLGSVVGVDRSSGRGSLMSCWTDRESLNATHQAVVGMRSAAARRLDGSNTTVETFEIALIHLAKPAEPGSCTRTTRTEMPPEDVDRALQSFKDTVMPFFEKYDRICAVMVMVNRETGVLQSSIILENREALEASSGRAQEVRDLITAAIPSVKIVEVFELEVVISDLRPSS
jgi:hypothetical protein